MSANTQSNANKSSEDRGVLKAHQIDLSKVTFGEIITNKHGGKSCRLQYDGRDLLIQSARMKLPFGISMNVDKDSNGKPLPGKAPKYHLDLSFAGYELNDSGVPTDKSVREFYDKMEGLHNVLIKAVHKNAEEWLGLSDCNESIAKAFARETIKFSKDKVTKKINNKYAPSLRGKLAFWDNKFSALAYDENKQPITDLRTALVNRAEVIAVMKVEGINIAQGKCGYSIKIIQLKVYRPAGIPSYAFIDDEEDNVPVKSTLTSAPENDNSSHNTHVDDSDDDNGKDELDAQDDDEEEEDKPPTPPPQNKKIIKTSTASKTVPKKK